MLIDETTQHVNKIVSFIESGKTKILILGNSGEGKTFLLNKIKEAITKDYPEYNVYNEDSYPIKKPYIMPCVSVETFDNKPRPLPDVIYTPKYSKAYKDSVMGIEMPEGSTFREYEALIRKTKIAKLNNEVFASVDEVKKRLEEV